MTYHVPSSPIQVSAFLDIQDYNYNNSMYTRKVLMRILVLYVHKKVCMRIILL
uniref:Uncharacterized protein n=1 Tax=Anguilla anguilla TaxID=7936 RepID=A0A0E9T0T2_ANGAN